MTINDYLQNLENQDAVEEKQIEVKRNSKVEEICRIFEQDNIQRHLQDKDNNHPIYIHYSKLLKGLDYTSKDVTDFSIKLKDYEVKNSFESLAGEFLSVLINRCKDENFTILTEHLSKKIIYLGFYNTKNITVHGKVYGPGLKMRGGIFIINGKPVGIVGSEMTGGKIIINGDTNAGIGQLMYDGEIHVKGSVNNGNQGDVGSMMIGGKIIIDSDVSSNIGYYMRGGLITIKGNVKADRWWSGSEILYGGKIVIDGNVEVIRGLDGGKVIIKGNLGEIFASNGRGGRIYVLGDLGKLAPNKTQVYHKGKRVGRNIFSVVYHNYFRRKK